MHVIRRRGWEIPERLATPEHLFMNRRAFLAATGAAALALSPQIARAQRAADVPDPTADLYPAKRNDRYVLDRPVTEEKINLNYNNFYEFGGSKQVSRAAQALKLRPWTVKLDGMVEKEQEVGIDDLLRQMPLEERLYRHRCVEAWGMAIPWSGFPLAKLVEMAKPLSSAKYLRMETFLDPSVAPGQRQKFYPWPYVEGVTMAEATNELAFLVTGAYGKPVSKVQGAPIRLALPWKYGFKSIKSITRFTFTDQRPKSYWEALQASEYGFWANVNPQVAHPRWSQATEEVIGTGGRRPTLLFNGYAEYVADIYKGLEQERLWT
ncbi:MAG: methionine sulfoxide reductase catalytic subunit [Alphaproteobacteria bacterium]|jgi:sulfoxide reductase catalytic subunit YedY|nr:methionine sulfoxide reductase catalytic subunit [Alphaproteobacteria bacterium]